VVDAVAQDWGVTGLAFPTGMPDDVSARDVRVWLRVTVLGAGNALVDRAVAEHRFAPC
jgi:hypothetical protein